MAICQITRVFLGELLCSRSNGCRGFESARLLLTMGLLQPVQHSCAVVFSICNVECWIVYWIFRMKFGKATS